MSTEYGGDDGLAVVDKDDLIRVRKSWTVPWEVPQLDRISPRLQNCIGLTCSRSTPICLTLPISTTIVPAPMTPTWVATAPTVTARMEPDPRSGSVLEKEIDGKVVKACGGPIDSHRQQV